MITNDSMINVLSEYYFIYKELLLITDLKKLTTNYCFEYVLFFCP